MIIAALALAAAAPPKSATAQPVIPTAADQAALDNAIKQCNLHAGSLYFIQYPPPHPTVIRLTREQGDTQGQLDCALNYLPKSFEGRFGLQFEP
jgi:hypothetical protein